MLGSFVESLDLGGGLLPAGGDPNGLRTVVARLSPSGDLLASRAFGVNLAPTNRSFVIDSAINPGGDLLVALSYQGVLDLGGGPLPATPGLWGLLARFTP
ncbi:MAG: hypothetical protein ABJE95_08360 [Byssovorax sp.]